METLRIRGLVQVDPDTYKFIEYLNIKNTSLSV